MNYPSKTWIIIYSITIIGTFLIVGGLVKLMQRYSRPPAVTAERIAERKKSLVDLNVQTKEQLESYGWVDSTKGVARMPISQAMEMVAKAGQNPAAVRSNLLERVAKANPPPPVFE